MRPATTAFALLVFCLNGLPRLYAAPPDKASFHLRGMAQASREELRRLKGTFAIHPDLPTPMVDVFIRLAPGRSKQQLSGQFPGARFNSQIGDIVTARIPLTAINGLSQNPHILSIEPSFMARPNLDVVRSAGVSGGLLLGTLSNVATDLNGVDGTGVIIGVIDTGIDWSHLDFINDDGTSRVLYLWDQTDGAGPGPSGFAYGTEWTQADLNDELDGLPAGVVRSSDTDGHGTHVTGIAAGNGWATNGALPELTFVSLATSAAIISVKYDGTLTGMADAANYIVGKGGALGRPVVINISQGSYAGAHDGTEAVEQILAALAVSTPIVVSAGNGGNKNVHAQFDMTLQSDVTVTVGNNLPGEATTLWAEFWYTSAQAYSVTVTLAGEPGSVTAADNTNNSGTLGTHSVTVANATNTGHPSGDKRVTVQITGAPITTASFDVAFSRTGAGGVVNGYCVYPNASFSTDSTGPTGTIATPATANNIVTVGSYCSHRTWTNLNNLTTTDSDCATGEVSMFSSEGPTRDARMKPDVVAPGEHVGAAMSTAIDPEPDSEYVSLDERHMFRQGTSMAAPVVASIIALMLQVDPALTPAQIVTALRARAREDDSTGALPNNAFGWGKVLGTPPVNATPTMDVAVTTADATSVTWEWTRNATNARYAIVLRAGDETDLSGDLSAATESWQETDLIPNTSYSAFVVLSNEADASTSTAISMRTLAAVPARAAPTGVTTTGLTANWDPNDNPVGTEFYGETAADAAFVDITANTGWGLGTSISTSGLTANTTAYFRARARNALDDWTPFGEWSEMTAADPPAALPLGLVGETSVAAAWTGNSNPPWTTFQAERDTDPGFVAAVASGWSTATDFNFTGLTPNTTYYFRVMAQNGTGTPTSPVSLGSTITWANPPLIAPPAAVYFSSITAGWLANGNPDGTEYYAEKADDAGFTTNLANSGWVTATSHPFTGLALDTTYYFRVTARSHGGTLTAVVDLSSTSTLAAAPAAAAAAAVTAASITADWTENGNPGNTQYYAETSADPGFSATANSGWSTATSFAFTSLTINSTYYFRVKARNSDGVETALTSLPTTATLAATPVAAAFSGVTVATAVAHWTGGGNPGSVRYTVESSTDGFASVNTSTTAAAALMLFGGGGAGEALLPNTTYSFRVRSLNWADLPSPDTSLGSTRTLAAAPGILAASDVQSGSITAAWTAGGNPEATEYNAEKADDDAFTVGYASSDWITATEYAFSGLTPGTTGYFRVRARNASGVETAVVDLPEQETLAAAPGASSPQSIGDTSITARWTANGNSGGVEYLAERADDAGFSANLTGSAWITGLTHTFSGLVANTTYYLRVTARNSNLIETSPTTLPTTMTSPLPPLSDSPTDVAATSMTANWLANGNPGTVEYLAEAAQDSIFSVAVQTSPWGTATSYNFTALTPNTTHYFRVRARNPTGGETAVASLPAQATLAAQPAAAPATDVAYSSITANWTANDNPGGTEYYAEKADDSGFSIQLEDSGWTTVLSHTFTGLLVNTTYYFRVKARDFTDTQTPPLNLPTTSTLALPPQYDDPSGITDTAVAANWTGGANPPGTEYLAERADDAAFTAGVTPGSWTTGNSETFSGLTANTTYYFRVRARSRYGVDTNTVPLAPALTLSPAPGAAPPSGETANSITANWTLNGNPPGTEFQAERANDDAFTIGLATSGWIAAESFVFTGLQGNATYYLRARARNDAKIPTASTDLGSALTLASPPVSAATLSATQNNITVSWTGGANSASTEYEAQRDTDPGFSGPTASGWIPATEFAFGGLAANTTYYFRVKARNAAGAETTPTSLPDAVTLAKVPAAAEPVTAAEALTLNWTANGNSAGTLYAAELSADDFASILISSATRELSARLGTGGEGAALSPNTTYSYRIRSFNHEDAASAYTAAASTYTRAYVPAAAAADVQTTSATVAWTANNNNAATQYRAERAPDAGFASVQDDSGWSTALTYAFTGLTPNTTHYFRVQARNNALVPTAYAALSSEVTLAAMPAALPPSAVSPTSIRANWGTNGNPGGTEFYLERAQDAGFTAGVSASGWLTATHHRFTGLTALTTYYFHVKARSHLGAETAYTLLPSTDTALVTPPPDQVSVSATYPSSITLSWLSVDSDDGYLLEASTAADFSGTVESSAAASDLAETLTVSGLDMNTTYYLRVGALSGPVTTYATPLSAATLPDTVTAGAYTGVFVSSAAASWTPLASGGYVLEASTDAAFGATTLSSSTANSNAAALTVSGLAPNTTYYFRVGSLSHDGRSNYTVLDSTDATRAADPISAPAYSGSADALQANWDANGNPADTLYSAELSADDFQTVDVASVTRETRVLYGGGGAGGALGTNTTYYLRVRAINRNAIQTADVSLDRGFTLALPPVSASFATVDVASLSVSWADNGNPAGTLYRAAVSTDDFQTVNITSHTRELNALFGSGGEGTALTPNTTFYVRIHALNRAGVPAGPAELPATPTHAAAPAADAPAGVAYDRITARWTANANPDGTLYRAQASTDAFVTTIASSFTLNTFAEFSGLLANTTHYLRVQAIGRNAAGTTYTALPATATFLLPPGVPSTVFSGVGTDAAVVHWDSGGNGTNTTYEAHLSTDALFTPSVSAQTSEVSAAFGAGGAGANLRANTTYYFRVRALGIGGPGDYVPLGSTSTFANGPAATAVKYTSGYTAYLDWDPNGNAEPGTRYEIWRDADSGFSSPTKTTASSSAYLAEGLSALTAYYFKVRTLGNNGDLSAFDTTVPATTLEPPPAAPGQPAVSMLGVSSISWTWSSVSGATGYRLRLSTDPTTLIGQVAGTSLTQTALAPNTQYRVFAQAFGSGGTGDASPVASATTLAAPPADISTAAVFGSSATLSWSANANPVGTLANVERSTDNAVFAMIASVSTETYTDYDMLGCTTYYFKVRNFNGIGIATDYGILAPFQTNGSTPLAPSALSARSLSGRRVALSWLPSPSAKVSAYRLYTDGGTGDIDYATPLAVLTSTVTDFTTNALVSSAAYVFGLRAFNECNIEESNVNVTAAAAAQNILPALRAAVVSPRSGQRSQGDSLTVAAELLLGTPALTHEVLFQYKASTGSVWVNIPAIGPTAHPNPDPVYPYFIQWDIDSLAATNYDIRAVAADLSAADQAPPSITITRAAGSDFDIREKKEPSGLDTSLEQTLHNDIENTVRAADRSTEQAVKVVFPAGALAHSTVTVRVTNSPSDLPNDDTGMLAAGVSAKITLLDHPSVLSGGKTATVVLTYPDGNNDGLVDINGIPARNLKIYTYDDIASRWTQGIAFTVDLESHTVTGLTPHFSFFALFAQPAHVLAREVNIYPIPFVPGNDDPNDGVAFNPGNADSGIIFSELPENTTISLYTVTGQRVTSFNSGRSNRCQWDGRNDSGRDAASGGYFAVISSPGQEEVVRKILIIR